MSVPVGSSMPSSQPVAEEREAVPVSPHIPLCVDLDGTLVKSDTLVDS